MAIGRVECEQHDNNVPRPVTTELLMASRSTMRRLDVAAAIR